MSLAIVFEMMQKVRRICGGTSVDDAMIGIRNESNLTLLDLCLQYESQHMKRSTMIRNLKARIRKLEKI